MFDGVQTALRELTVRLDVGALDAEQAVDAAASLAALRATIDSLILAVARRADICAAHRERGDRDVAQTLARALGTTNWEARRTTELARRLEHCPATEHALSLGEVTAKQAELIVGAAAHNPVAETSLLRCAASGITPLRDACLRARAEVESDTERSRRQHRARFLRTWTSTDGMVEGRFSLPPEIGAPVLASLERATRAAMRAQAGAEYEPIEAYAADAFVAMLTTRDHRVSAPRTVVHVVIDHAVLVRGDALPGERCEIPGVGPVSAEWVRSILGESFLTAVVRRGIDITTVAHLGRRTSAELLTAMIVAGRECAVDGCHARGYLEQDHCEVDVAAGGPTALWNLAWLCSHHHRLKTSGWRLGSRDPASGKRTLRSPERPPPSAV